MYVGGSPEPADGPPAPSPLPRRAIQVAVEPPHEEDGPGRPGGEQPPTGGTGRGAVPGRAERDGQRFGVREREGGGGPLGDQRGKPGGHLPEVGGGVGGGGGGLTG